jgi:outer membrane protein
MRKSSWNYAVLAATVSLCLSTTAQAQDDYSPNVASESSSENHITIGAGAALLPEFQGSKNYFIQPVPVVDIEQGPFFVRLGDGIGINVIDTGNFKVGASVTALRGYDAEDVPEGIGGLDDSFGGRGFVSATVGGVVATLSATMPFTGDAKGMIAEAELSYPVQVTDRLSIVPGLSATWADKKYLRRYYGVNAQQAAASVLAEYEPSSGFQDAGATLAINYRVTNHISLVAAAMVSYNFDRVANSPFTEQRWQPIGVLGVAYRF